MAATAEFSPTHDDIALRAYEIYLSNGALDGRDLEHWLRAEAELRDGARHEPLTLVG